MGRLCDWCGENVATELTSQKSEADTGLTVRADPPEYLCPGCWFDQRSIEEASRLLGAATGTRGRIDCAYPVTEGG